MPETKLTVETEPKVSEGTGTTETQPVVGTEPIVKEVEGSDDIDAKVQKLADGIVAKKLAKMPTKEELKAFKDWQESQKTEDQKKQDELLERKRLEDENSSLKMEKEILKKGIKDEDIDYVLFKLSKMTGDFEDNLVNFLKNNPKFLDSSESTPSVNTGVATQREALPKVDGVTAILKNKHPNLF